MAGTAGGGAAVGAAAAAGSAGDAGADGVRYIGVAVVEEDQLREQLQQLWQQLEPQRQLAQQAKQQQQQQQGEQLEHKPSVGEQQHLAELQLEEPHAKRQRQEQQQQQQPEPGAAAECARFKVSCCCCWHACCAFQGRLVYRFHPAHVCVQCVVLLRSAGLVRVVLREVMHPAPVHSMLTQCNTATETFNVINLHKLSFTLIYMPLLLADQRCCLSCACLHGDYCLTQRNTA
jgi:hypothetical protein